MELSKSYNPKKIEQKIYKFWQENGFFKAKAEKDKIPYTIVLPPPNITGHLHMGHALDETIQDIIIRFKRMQGFNALWVPGTDHAAIATEVKIVQDLKAKGLSKEALGREKFMEKAFEWKEKYGGKILEQIKSLGASCDFSRERFTMDEVCTRAVNEFFVRLYNDGLIYRGERIINWCPNCKTSLSDAEVDHKETDGNFYHIKYPLQDGSGFLKLATTRPETLLGDTAVAVNPKDERYKHLVGKNVVVPFSGRIVPIIADDYVEMDFGTGVVKVTPAHDPNDFLVGQRHNLPVINVMTETAFMNENAGKYQGLERHEARKQIVKDLKEEDLLEKIESIKHNVGVCYRCSEKVEPWISTQWFVKMQELAKPAINCVANGEIKFVPERFDKIYFNWMENIKDWCISRQIWWGHRIPAYYCEDCGEIEVCATKVKVCKKCGSNNIKQDESTLDTWFSSALWPFEVFGWPENTEDLDYFFPTQTLVTGYDIIFFWVARMIFASLYNTKKIPFKTVYIHGLVRDEQGRKMSKSLGNGIDPLEVIAEYGADALRFSLVSGNSPGNDMRFSFEKVKASGNFANKIWNAARYILMNIEGLPVEDAVPEILNLEDKWILHTLNEVNKEVCENLEKFEFGLALQKIYDFIWDYFCDWYIELTKIRLQNSDEKTAINTKNMLVFIFSCTLKLLHPFMPFLTEEIWQCMPHKGKTICLEAYPKFNEKFIFEQEFESFEQLIELVKLIRSRRSEINVSKNKKTNLFIETQNLNFYTGCDIFIKKLVSADSINIAQNFDIPEALTIIFNKDKIFIPMKELVDPEQELKKLEKDLEHFNQELILCQTKINNPGFINSAPAILIERVKSNLNLHSEKIKSLENAILKIKDNFN